MDTTKDNSAEQAVSGSQIIKTCVGCGKQWMEKPSHHWRKFCSVKCKSEAVIKAKTLPCPQCGTVRIIRSPWRAKKICRACANANHSALMKTKSVNVWKYITKEGHARICAAARSPERLKRLRSPELRRNNLAAVRASQKAGHVETNIHAKRFNLRSPRGQIYTGRNLSLFVDEHPELFDPLDLRKVRYKSFASGQLSRLRPETRQPLATWKGWTWVSITERRFNDGVDLLARET